MVAERICLKCGKFFLSVSAGNRICAACKRRQLTLEDVHVYHDTTTEDGRVIRKVLEEV
jgi:hypothetical protein